MQQERSRHPGGHVRRETSAVPDVDNALVDVTNRFLEVAIDTQSLDRMGPGILAPRRTPQDVLGENQLR